MILKVALFGPSGMLGRQVTKALSDADHVVVPVYRRMFELVNHDSVERAVDGCDAVINCAGVIPLKNTNIIDMIYVNSIFPHVLASCGLPTLLISTDCVFSGRNQHRYNIKAVPDPRDYYGKSKALGEVVASNCAVIRTSFIGCDHGFMNWVLSAGLVAKSLGITQRIDGYKNALWTGSTVQEVASWLVNSLESPPVGQVVHLATEQVINKYDLAIKLVELHELNVQVLPAYQPVMNRALDPTHILPPIDEALLAYKCSNAQVGLNTGVLVPA